MIPADYLASRTEFAERAKRLGVTPLQFIHGTEEGGVVLTTDVAYFGPADADAIVVIASGTHGVEAYAGTACQFRFMERYRDDFASNGMAWLLVHAVNPWGYFHDCRVTRENVDLNRNFVDFPLAARDTSEPIADYAAYHDLLVTRFRPLPRGLWNEIRLLSNALTPSRRRRLQAAITAGQHAFPDGLFYGGTAPTTSRMLWEEIVRTYAAWRGRAALLDIHTGLGKRGAGELISYLPPSSPAFRKMNGWFGGTLKSMASGESVSAAVEGTLTAGFDRMASGTSYAIGLEFGTCSPLAVLNAMREDQWYRNHAATLSAADRERARRRMKAAFVGAEAAWRESVIARFDEVIEQLAHGLANDSSSA